MSTNGAQSGERRRVSVAAVIGIADRDLDRVVAYRAMKLIGEEIVGVFAQRGIGGSDSSVRRLGIVISQRNVLPVL